MVFSCVLKKLDEDDDKEDLAEANALQKDEVAIAQEEDPVLMLGESHRTRPHAG